MLNTVDPDYQYRPSQLLQFLSCVQDYLIPNIDTDSDQLHDDKTPSQSNLSCPWSEATVSLLDESTAI